MVTIAMAPSFPAKSSDRWGFRVIGCSRTGTLGAMTGNHPRGPKLPRSPAESSPGLR